MNLDEMLVAPSHRIDVQHIPVGVLEPDQPGAAGQVDVALQAADLGIVLEHGAVRLQRGDHRVELAADAPDHGVRPVGAGVVRAVDDQAGLAGAVDQHFLRRAFLDQLQPEYAAVERAGAGEIGHRDDGGGIVVL